MYKLFFGHIHPDTKEHELIELCESFGPVGKIFLKTGYAFVEMEDEEDALDLIRDVDGTTFNGQKVNVEASRQQKGDHFQPGERSCHCCGEMGHFARDCPQKNQSDRGAGFKPSRSICYNCGKSGHFSRECRNTRGYDTNHRFEKQESRDDSYDSGKVYEDEDYSDDNGSYSGCFRDHYSPER